MKNNILKGTFLGLLFMICVTGLYAEGPTLEEAKTVFKTTLLIYLVQTMKSQAGEEIAGVEFKENPLKENEEVNTESIYSNVDISSVIEDETNGYITISGTIKTVGMEDNSGTAEADVTLTGGKVNHLIWRIEISQVKNKDWDITINADGNEYEITLADLK